MIGNDYEFACADRTDIDGIMDIERLGFAEGIVERRDVFVARMSLFPDGFLVLRNVKSRCIVGYICSELWEYSPNIETSKFLLNHHIGEHHTVAGNEIYISSMTIHPDYRKEGLGRLMFRHCLQTLRNKYQRIAKAILIVNETWIHAIRIYDEEGFCPLMRMEGFFTPVGTDVQDAIVMRKALRDIVAGKK